MHLWSIKTLEETHFISCSFNQGFYLKHRVSQEWAHSAVLLTWYEWLLLFTKLLSSQFCLINNFQWESGISGYKIRNFRLLQIFSTKCNLWILDLSWSFNACRCSCDITKTLAPPQSLLRASYVTIA